MTAREAFDAFNTYYGALYLDKIATKLTKAELIRAVAGLQPLVDDLRKSIFVDDATQHSEEIIEELRATIEELEQTAEAPKRRSPRRYSTSRKPTYLKSSRC